MVGADMQRANLQVGLGRVRRQAVRQLGPGFPGEGVRPAIRPR